ncbi:aminotransferase class I/II-fold pyridoxal phosphate-dependent enzyme [Microlunatus aurantiacus]|uniref:Aminotransferase class I/II-fold pyridoxal phosphate-dependent enzyme n=1 Tax=Microlunatus aurantiacus TaxID=446786 RepID=A0ABP7D1K0_9ACTN
MTSSTPVPPHRPVALHPTTVAVHAGRPATEPDAPLNPPVVFAATYVGVEPSGQGERGYGRYGNPTWSALEEAVGALEGGTALAYGSGMAAAHAALELVPAGGVLVLPTHCYLGVAASAEERAARDGLQLRRVDIANTDEVLAAADGADLVWLESPTNPMMEVADLPALCGALRGRVTTVVDSTFATPLRQQPLELGADLVLHSGTKFISGHSDALLGLLVGRDGTLMSRLEGVRKLHGAAPGTMEAYLVLRGLRTLPLRLNAAEANAQVLAERLAAHPAVNRVRYPGLADDPGHAVAARTMSGPGSLLSIELADGPTAIAFVAALELWVFATSLGGVESMLERRRRWAGELATVPEGLVRLSVGIEHVEDLWADLAQALDAAAGPSDGAGSVDD